MRRLLSGPAALAIASTIAFAGLATGRRGARASRGRAAAGSADQRGLHTGPNGPLDEAIEPIALAPANNIGSTLVLTGAEFSGTTSAPNVLPVRFTGAEGIPALGGVAVFGSLPRLPSRSTASHSRHR